MLASLQQAALLAAARAALCSRFGAPPPPFPSDVVIQERCSGVFVTLWNRGRLRGCIGNFNETADLLAAVRDTALAALADPRFTDNPVTLLELDDIDVEVSLLSPRVKMNHVRELVPGVHGIYVRRAARIGCFLPKVAAERGWSAEQFLAQCCVLKAGLEPDAWQRPDAEVFVFTADVFSDGSRRAPR